MKWLFLIICTLIVSSCSDLDATRDSVVQIRGIHDGVQVVRGMGVCIDDSMILTSAHVVRDDRFFYEIMGMRYQVVERDLSRDIAYMQREHPEQGETPCRVQRKYIGKEYSHIDDSIHIPLLRSGSIVVVDGQISGLTGNILGYDTLGHIEFMTGMLMTDIVFESGDSGAPILDEDGRVIDVVHIQ